MKHTIICLLKILPSHSSLIHGWVICLLLFESNYVAYQIKENEEDNTMQAKILPFYTPNTPGWDQKVKTILKKVMLHIKLIEKKQRTLCK